ncbi:kynureninase [Chitinolyticbacter meiyuanensis]|uniref:kynureninase n=1 Tax=Chitinolyticbacter meiyuanensis TaxID=682798 RepID=UPI001FEC7D60|nr:kynureninase [Chitinolyticbacter meiyuanensis]
MLTRSHALALDAHDELASLRNAFDLPPGIYLDGNSLGALPHAAKARIAALIEHEWGQGLIASWNAAGWYAAPRRIGDRLAPWIGAAPGEVVVTDSISVNLFKLLSAALTLQRERTPRRRVIVSERSNFPTDLYIVQGLIAQLDAGYTLRLVDDAADLAKAIDDDVAVVLLTHVNYRTGAMHDMAGLTIQCHAQGALVIWDLAHSAGAVPVDLNGCGADFAVGCSYKYLNAGPGAPAFLWVPKRHQHLPQPLSGWWGHADPFAMAPQFQAADGIARFLSGTPSPLGSALLGVSLDVFEHTTMAILRAKSLALTDLFIALVEAQCPALQLVTPREHAARGSQVSLYHEQGYAMVPGTDRARHRRRLSRTGHPALRLHPALYPLRRRVGCRRGVDRRAGEPGMG